MKVQYAYILRLLRIESCASTCFECCCTYQLAVSKDVSGLLAFCTLMSDILAVHCCVGLFGFIGKCHMRMVTSHELGVPSCQLFFVLLNACGSNILGSRGLHRCLAPSKQARGIGSACMLDFLLAGCLKGSRDVAGASRVSTLSMCWRRHAPLCTPP